MMVQARLEAQSMTKGSVHFGFKVRLEAGVRVRVRVRLG